MKRTHTILALCLVCAIPVMAQRKNSVGLDFAGYIVGAPKHKLPGDKYNPYTESTSSAFGLHYERFFNLATRPYSAKVGFYYNTQHNYIHSLHIPVDFNGNILGKRNESTFYLGYTGGISYNRILMLRSNFIHLIPEGTSAVGSIKRNSYIAPHIGLNSGLNLGRFCLSGIALYHFMIPEYIDYTVTHSNHTVTEHNTNKNRGVSIRLGLQYRF